MRSTQCLRAPSHKSHWAATASEEGLEALQPGEAVRRLERLHEAEGHPVALAPGCEPDLLELSADPVELLLRLGGGRGREQQLP